MVEVGDDMGGISIGQPSIDRWPDTYELRIIIKVLHPEVSSRGVTMWLELCVDKFGVFTC